MGDFNTNFVTHEVAFVVLRNAFFCGFGAIEFLQQSVSAKGVVYYAKHGHLQRSHNQSCYQNISCIT